MDNLDKLTDEELQSRAARGSREAEDALLMRHQNLVRACSRPFFLTGGDSEDLVQEGMIGLLSAVRLYDPQKGASFRTFAVHCIRNRILSALRAADREKNVPLNNYVPLESPSFYESRSEASGLTRDPEELVISKERLEELAASVASLSPLETDVLSLFLDGLSYADMAKRLGRDGKSVDNAVQRIRKKLMRYL